MREIKFRAWVKTFDDSEPRMEYLPMQITTFDFENGEVLSFTEESEFYVFEGYKDRKPHLFEIMQYTGLKDKNGAEIYEGDIMKVLDRDWTDMEKDTKTFIVYYAKDAFILTTQEGIKERESENPNQYNQKWIEVKLSREYGRDKFEIIGNIYQNIEI